MHYDLEPDLAAEDFLDLLRRSTLSERRPSDLETLDAMLRHASLIVTARQDGRLVGIARALTDFAYCTYLSDLAVDVAMQHQGIGKRLLKEVHERAGLHTTLILLAAPAAREYYPRVGMTRHDSCWITPGRKA